MAVRRRWIARAITRPGAFTAAAKRAGLSTKAFAVKVIRGGPKRFGLRRFRQAVLTRTLAGLPRAKGPRRRRR